MKDIASRFRLKGEGWAALSFFSRRRGSSDSDLGDLCWRVWVWRWVEHADYSDSDSGGMQTVGVGLVRREKAKVGLIG